ncbi:type II secretion system F family protein [archaeon]|nr:type II secretion system F family protein [archaeon]
MKKPTEKLFANPAKRGHRRQLPFFLSEQPVLQVPEKTKLPFAPFPPHAMNKIAGRFIVQGNWLSKKFSSLSTDLIQAKISVEPRVYGALVFTTALFYAALMFFLFLILSVVVRANLAPIGILFGLMFFIFMISAASFYPRALARKRMRRLESNLIPALQHLTIELKSGVPLYNAMNGIASGYDEISKEFAQIVRDVSTGMRDTDALAESARRNPSFQFRRAVWQITNALRAGSDVGVALEALIQDFSNEQITSIRRYGQELNPWTMIYMVGAVIIPSLGLTFLTIISSFASVTIPKVIFPVIIFSLLGFQLFFMNFVKTKRPAV